jgi:hypothetical protein
MRLLLLFCFILIKTSAAQVASFDYTSGCTKTPYVDSLQSFEQPNPLFRCPLPKIYGEKYLNIQLVLIEEAGKTSIPSFVIIDIQNSLDKLFSPHGIHFIYKQQTILQTNNRNQQLRHWENNYLPISENQITLYIVPELGAKNLNKKCYNFNELLPNEGMIPFYSFVKAGDYTCKKVCTMLGLLPNFYSNAALNVMPETKKTSTVSGDFVVDTKPMDKKSLTNQSWPEQLNTITSEQANKIKYNLEVIPKLKDIQHQFAPIEVGNNLYSSVNTVMDTH